MADAIPRFNARNLPDSRFRTHPQSIIKLETDLDLDALRDASHRRGRPARAATDDRPAVVVPIRLTPAIETCPLPASWQLWDLFGHDYRQLSADEHRTCAAARLLLPLESHGPLSVDWEVGPGDARYPSITAPEPEQPNSTVSRGSPTHVHADLAIDGHAVHIDHLHATRGGPLRGYHEVRIFVDGRLAGRGGRCGCSLGFGGNDLPAVAAIGQDTAIAVGHCSRGVLVELWRAHLIGRM